MKRVNLFEMYRLGGCIRFFENLTPETHFADIKQDCATAWMWFDLMLRHVHIPIVDAREDADFLKVFCLQALNENGKEKLGGKRCEIIRYRFSRFENLLEVELGKLNIYHVTKLLAYDTDTLLSSGRVALPESTLDFLSSDVIKCFEEGTRCLALKLPTSAGFNFLRAVEGAMHEYYDVISNGAPRPKSRNMGQYIDALEKLPSADERMVDALRSIKNLHRNPLMHPEEFLEPDDAVVTFNVAMSSISTMAALVRELKEKSAQGTTT